MPAELELEYVLPLRWSDDAGLDDLTDYLRAIGRLADTTVVDGSAEPLFREHAARWAGTVRHLRPEPWPGRNGKVAGVMTGLRHARHDRVVIADDDVRYDESGLRRIAEALTTADVVRPQNYFSALPWHARWDTARTLVNRAVSSDYPGTLGVHRDLVLAAGGYAGDVLFENLELIRTVRQAGGSELKADDLFVARVPPTTSQFWGQRIRQAYDSFAQPERLMAELAILPAIGWSLRHRPWLLALAAASVALAEAGRRRAGAAAVFPGTAALWAPVWVAERGVCAWLAVGMRMRGGVPYRGSRLLHSVSTVADRRSRAAVPVSPSEPTARGRARDD